MALPSSLKKGSLKTEKQAYFIFNDTVWFLTFTIQVDVDATQELYQKFFKHRRSEFTQIHCCLSQQQKKGNSTTSSFTMFSSLLTFAN